MSRSASCSPESRADAGQVRTRSQHDDCRQQRQGESRDWIHGCAYRRDSTRMRTAYYRALRATLRRLLVNRLIGDHLELTRTSVGARIDPVGPPRKVACLHGTWPESRIADPLRQRLA
jgi:hypothetical protein